MSEYYFNKGFIQLTCDDDHLKTVPLWVKDIVGAELKVNSYLVILCYTTITSTSNTLKTYISVKIIIHPIQLKNSILKKKQWTDYSVHLLHHK